MTNRQPPNILLLHWHDLGRCLGCYGWPGVSSPNLDRLAAEGVAFDQAFCTTPLCSPARGAIFTGRYPHQNGLMGLIPQGWAYHRGEQLWPKLLREHGYHTALVGQQHESFCPQTLGFQTMRMVDFWPTCDLIAPMAEEFLRGEALASQPFFASIGFFDVHRLGKDHYPADRYPPVDPASFEVPAFLDDNPQTRSDLAGFYGAIRVADAALGRILDTLDEVGLRENTWVIFTTDHGMAFPGAKSTLYEPGVGVSLIMRWPAGFEGRRRVQGLVSHVDLMPTVHEAMGFDRPTGVDGVSFWSSLCEPHAATPRHALFCERTHHGTHYDPMRSIRTSRYKYIRNFEPGHPPPIPGDVASSGSASQLPDRLKTARPAQELYDLDADPYEAVNLADEPGLQVVRQDLADQLSQWMNDTDDPIRHGPIELPAAAN